MTSDTEKMRVAPLNPLQDKLQAFAMSFNGWVPAITAKQVDDMLRLPNRPTGLAWEWSKHFGDHQT